MNLPLRLCKFPMTMTAGFSQWSKSGARRKPQCLYSELRNLLTHTLLDSCHQVQFMVKKKRQLTVEYCFTWKKGCLMGKSRLLSGMLRFHLEDIRRGHISALESCFVLNWDYLAFLSVALGNVERCVCVCMSLLWLCNKPSPKQQLKCISYTLFPFKVLLIYI